VNHLISGCQTGNDGSPLHGQSDMGKNLLPALDFLRSKMNLPPMNSLKVFEVVSRQMSIARAAEELSVSHGAVSQQIRNLENHLGLQLFERLANSLKLTESGAAFASVVHKALFDILEAAANLEKPQTPHRLTISAPPSFAIKWLIPNLSKFHEHHPGIEIQVDITAKLVTFKNDGIDAAIRFGTGKYEDVESFKLLQTSMIIVACADYVRRYGSLARPTNGPHRLIHLKPPTKMHAKLHLGWSDVFTRSELRKSFAHVYFPEEHMASAAALHGQGVALMETIIAHCDIQSAALIRADPAELAGISAYYFVVPKTKQLTQTLQAFRDWLKVAMNARADDG
jgi:LysR family transcriptional regulator, glycine cleavage system transcriptional activator